MGQQNRADKTYKLTHRDFTAHQPLGTVTADSFEKAMEIVQSPREQFNVGDQDIVGIKENRNENFRYDIMIESSTGRDGFIYQHSYIEITRVAEE